MATDAETTAIPQAPARILLEGHPAPTGKYVYQIEVAYAAGWAPIYVGVGTGARARMHFSAARGTRRGSGANREMIATLRMALSGSEKAQIVILAEGLSKRAADELEIKTIARLGRRLIGNGTLLNVLAGGASPDPESCRALRQRIPPELRVAAAERAATRRRWRAAAVKAAASKTAEQHSNAARKAAATRKLRLAESAVSARKEAVADAPLSAAQKAARTRRRRLAALRAAETKRLRAATAPSQAP